MALRRIEWRKLKKGDSLVYRPCPSNEPDDEMCRVVMVCEDHAIAITDKLGAGLWIDDDTQWKFRKRVKVGQFVYRAEFHLTNSVNDLQAARKYLTEDDMTKYLLNDERGSDKVTKVEWVLEDKASGYIEVRTREKLEFHEIANIADWIRGQNSDGLGEGFEQQDFAVVANDPYDDDEEYYDGYVEYASFDWQTNRYMLKLVEG